MKLVEILANEMEEWPVGVTHLTQSEVDREIYDGLDGKTSDSVRSLNPRFDALKSHSEKSYPMVTRAEWQAERDRQKGGEWKRHRGGSMPKHVSPTDMVECKRRDGEVTAIDKASAFTWPHKHCRATPYRQIMSYRVISQPQAEEVEVIEPISTYKEFQLTGQWHQIDGPILWRDTVNELDAYIEEFTREREALINRLSEEGFALIPPSASVVSKFSADVDMSDWRNWKDGDIVEVVFKNDAGLPIGKQCVVATIEKPDYIYGMPVSVYDEDANDGSFFWPEDITEEGSLVFKFIRRP